MKFEAAKTKKWLVGFSSCLMVVFSLLPAASAAADSFPYIKVYGGDVAAGGGFDTSGPDCTGGSYQGSYGRSGADKNSYGGIFTFANNTNGTNSNGGSSAQYGVSATGTIDNSPASGSIPAGGFYGAAAQPGGNFSQLSFANIGSLGWGGNFDGGQYQPRQCIPDYYTTYYPTDSSKITGSICAGLPSHLTTSGVYVADLSDPACNSQALIVDNNALDMTRTGDPIIDAGVKATIIVKGNVYIGHSIRYAAHDLTNTPKLMMIVLGNLYIGPGGGHEVPAVNGIAETADELDGWYVAQPNPSVANTGVIWTCSSRADSSGVTSSDFMKQSCTTNLVIKGSLTADRIMFDRINGNVALTNAGEDQTSSSCEAAVLNGSAGEAGGPNGETNCSNISEIINYNPDVVVGGGYYNPNTTQSGTKLQKLVSLPPVF